MFSNVAGSACGGYRVVNSQAGSLYTAYQAVGGKSVLGWPLWSVWTSDGPALQAFDTMVLGAVPATSAHRPCPPSSCPPLLTKLDIEAVANADIPLPWARPPTSRPRPCSGLPVMDGEVIWEEPDGYYHYPSMQHVRAWLAEVGFAIQGEAEGSWHAERYAYHHMQARLAAPPG